ncbi:D-xylose ABC transporter substrate-binding protein [Elstera sp.]|jgi:D-xylose transport system substrate-binding protein|uniref:D-xylose ABC transporter substrate-binding protein n=1 Tax=Elstera sp. TaxID=1916664 RepID=UPI0037C028A6
MNVKSLALGLVAGASLLALATGAQAQSKLVVGVSWSNFQEERWKIDEAAIKKQLAAVGAEYISADAQSNPQKQLADVESLIARGAKALIVLAQDAQAIQPAVAKAKAEKIPVLGYDRLIEVPGVFYLTFDNIEVGRMMAREIQKAKPTGNYVFIKGYNADPNADFLAMGSKEVLKPAIDKGDIKIVGEQYTDRWLPENAQKNMEQILTANNNKVDAVVAANDGTAGGAVAAMTAQGLSGIPISGQDADQAALNRIARGLQTVTIWKDARTLGQKAAEVAAELAKGTAMDKIPGAFKWADGPNKVSLDTILLKPVPVTRDNLDAVISAGWSTKEQVCRGATANPPAACK